MTDLPEQFVERMRQMMGEEALCAFLSSYDAPMYRGLRLNPLKFPARAACPTLRSFSLRPVPWAQPYGFYYGIGREDSLQTAGPAGPGADPRSGGSSAAAAAQEAPGSADPRPGMYPTAAAAPETQCSADPRPGRSPLHEAGLYYMQEPSAMAPAALSGTQPGERILDLCAAPGGKTTMLAAMLGGQGLLVANEIDPGRARILAQNTERMGIANAVVTNESPERLAERFPAFFDRVLVDAPCSGEGMFRKETQALTMWSPENVERCAARQAGILDCAAQMIRSGGTLIYSTCTFSPEEDEGSAAAFLQRHPEFSAVDLPSQIGEERMRDWGFEPGRPEWTKAAAASEMSKTLRLWPHRLKGEGHYIALLRKAGTVGSRPAAVGGGLCLSGNRRKQQGEQKPLSAFLSENLSADIAGRLARESGSGLIRFGESFWLMPYREAVSLEGLRVLRPGLQLGTVRKDRLEPAHALAMALRDGETVRQVNLDPEGPEASAYLHGETLPCESGLKGWTLVTVGGISVGWGKAAGGVLRNHYPKGLRRPY